MVFSSECGTKFDGRFCPECGAGVEILCYSCEKPIKGKLCDIDGSPHCSDCYNMIESTISVAMKGAASFAPEKTTPVAKGSVNAKAKFCSGCGAKTTPGTRFCSDCGAKLA